jgi:hypothetical protein
MLRLAMTLVLCSAAYGAEWTGYISETHCGAAHQDGSAASVQCVKGCIRDGAQAVLVVDGKVVKISNTGQVPEALYGLKVKVSGELKGGAIEIATIAAAK